MHYQMDHHWWDREQSSQRYAVATSPSPVVCVSVCSCMIGQCKSSGYCPWSQKREQHAALHGPKKGHFRGEQTVPVGCAASSPVRQSPKLFVERESRCRLGVDAKWLEMKSDVYPSSRYFLSVSIPRMKADAKWMKMKSDILDIHLSFLPISIPGCSVCR